MLVDRKVLINGARFGGNPNGEDIDFCLSAKSKGHTVWCLNKNLTTHLSMIENWKPTIENDEIKNVAISCHTGVGDAIIASAFITKLKQTQSVNIDVYTWQYGINKVILRQ